MDYYDKIFHSFNWSGQITSTKLHENALLAKVKNLSALPLAPSVISMFHTGNAEHQVLTFTDSPEGQT